jgi:acetylglutamate kinase
MTPGDDQLIDFVNSRDDNSPLYGSNGMDDAIIKAGVLIEALPYIRRFRDRMVVIKVGGSYMENETALRDTLLDVLFMETVGLRPIIVHGGGKAITRAMQQAGLAARFVQGRRYTDEATLAIVAQVLVHEINSDIVQRIDQLGGRAAGLHHQTSQCLFARQTYLTGSGGETIDLGRVGEVTSVDTRLIKNLCQAGVVAVIPSLAVDEAFRSSPPNVRQLLNVNADTAAAAVACQLQAEKLIVLTDTSGIWLDRHDPSSKVASLSVSQCRSLIERGVIDAGMIPKVEACLSCLAAGIPKTHIIDGRLRHSLLLEIYTDKGVGTEIVVDG